MFIDEENRVERHLLRRMARGVAGGEQRSDVPGVLFLEIDGLDHDVLRRAMRDGDAPELASWVHDGTHRLLRWETDWSSQTGACQAGLLHGSNADMPGFRWWEKERGAPIVTNRPHDAAELERRVSDGRGLLHAGGASRANILSGDAPHTLLTMSTVLAPRSGGLGRDYFTYFASPFNMARTLMLSLADVAGELRGAALQRRRDVRPRVHRGLRYALVRAYATVVQRDLQVEAVLGDVYAGRPAVYTTFLAYDEVAHHSGLERADTLAVLRRVDREIGRIARAVTRATRRRTVDGEVRLGEAPVVRTDVPEISVMASGCLGLITFPRLPGRVTRAELDARYPALLQTLRTHPGIGFVLVDGVVHGARGWRVVRGAGTHVVGEDPLAPYGPLAPARYAAPPAEVVGAEAMHRVLRGWLADLGQEAYR